MVCDIPEEELAELVPVEVEVVGEPFVVPESELELEAVVDSIVAVLVLMLELTLVVEPPDEEMLPALVVVAGVVPELVLVVEPVETVVPGPTVDDVVVPGPAVDELLVPGATVDEVIVPSPTIDEVVVPTLGVDTVVDPAGFVDKEELDVVLLEEKLVVDDNTVLPDELLDAVVEGRPVEENKEVVGELVEVTTNDIPELVVAVVADTGLEVEVEGDDDDDWAGL